MKDDRIYQWWVEYKFEAFHSYMRAWYKPFAQRGEDHTKADIRTDRAITYLDEFKGFIKQALLIKYGMEFVETITELYWSTETEQNDSPQPPKGDK